MFDGLSSSFYKMFHLLHQIFETFITNTTTLNTGVIIATLEVVLALIYKLSQHDDWSQRLQHFKHF
jgi:hypothetical protein